MNCRIAELAGCMCVIVGLRPDVSAAAATVMEAPGIPVRPAAAPLIEVREVSVRFGGIVALDRVSFDIAPGNLFGLIGPNGAGKTTLFNCFSRLYTPNSGDIVFEGRSHPRPAAASHRRDRHRPHVPEPRAVPHHVGARQCARRQPSARPHRFLLQRAEAARGRGARRTSFRRSPGS